VSNIKIDDFYACAPAYRCIYRPTKELWPNASVDARLSPQPFLDQHGNPVRDKKGKAKTIAASLWLAQNRSVERMVWLPGADELIRDKLAVECGWIPKAGAANYNLYLPPNAVAGDATKAGRWIEHLRALYPTSAARTAPTTGDDSDAEGPE
jgi:hypothetical protein